MTSQNRKHSEETKEIARKLRKDGQTYQQISQQLAIAKSLIRRWCDPIACEKEKAHCRVYHEQWYAKPEKKQLKAEYGQKRAIEYPEKVKDIKIRSRLKNKAQNLEKAHYRYYNDPIFKILGIQRERIRRVLMRNKVIKNDRTVNYLGCTGQELKQHIEQQFQKGMTWQNHGNFGWHIDHIQSLRVFDLTDPEQQQIAFWYTNLQPLWWYENLSKNRGFRFEKNK